MESDHEEFIFNKYGVIYLLGNLWISVLSILVGLVVIIWKRLTFSEPLVFAILLALLSLYDGIRHRHLVERNSRVYNEEYAETHYLLWKYATAILAIIIFVFLGIYSGC